MSILAGHSYSITYNLEAALSFSNTLVPDYPHNTRENVKTSIPLRSVTKCSTADLPIVDLILSKLPSPLVLACAVAQVNILPVV